MMITPQARLAESCPYYVMNGPGCLVHNKHEGGEVKSLLSPLVVLFSWQVDVVLKHKSTMVCSLASFCDEQTFQDAIESSLEFARRAINRYEIDENSTLSVVLEGYVNASVYQQERDGIGQTRLQRLAVPCDSTKGVYVGIEDAKAYFALPPHERVGLSSPVRLNQQHGPIPLLTALSGSTMPSSDMLSQASWEALKKVVPYPVCRREELLDLHTALERTSNIIHLAEHLQGRSQR